MYFKFLTIWSQLACEAASEALEHITEMLKAIGDEVAIFNEFERSLDMDHMKTASLDIQVELVKFCAKACNFFRAQEAAASKQSSMLVAFKNI